MIYAKGHHREPGHTICVGVFLPAVLAASAGAVVGGRLDVAAVKKGKDPCRIEAVGARSVIDCCS